MHSDIEVVDLLGELAKKNDPVSRRAAQEIDRLLAVIARNCDLQKAATDGDRWVIEYAKRRAAKGSN
jgi:hypothetical protein